jgi:UDP-N-acetylmuramate--alanine ligase
MHHPTVNAVYQAVRELYPIKVLALFQPHLFSRTKDFADDFAKVYLNLTSIVDGYLSSSLN